MSFIRKKIFEGNEYFYQVKSVRKGDKVVQEHIKYWGAVKPSKEQMIKVDELYKKGKLKEIKRKPITKREKKEKERKKINEKRKSELKELSKIFEENKDKYSEENKELLSLLLREKKVARWTDKEWKSTINYITNSLEKDKIIGTKEERIKALNETLILMKKADDVKLSKKVRENAEVKLRDLKRKYGITFKDMKDYEKEIKKQQYKKPEPKEKYHGWDRENITKDIISFFDKSGENDITVAKMSTGEWEVNPSTIIFETQTFKSKKESLDFAIEQMKKNSPEKPKILLKKEEEPKTEEEYLKKTEKILKERKEELLKQKEEIEKLKKEPTLRERMKKRESEMKKSDFVSEKLRLKDRPTSKWANVDDMSIDRLYLGATNTYSDPSGVAIRQQNSYVKSVNRFANELMEIAETPEQIKQAEFEIQKYKENYLKKYLAKVDADSRTASTFITGASNFPHKQNQKRLDIAHKRMGEFIQWEEKAKPRAIKNVEKSFSGDISERELINMKAMINSNLNTVKDIDTKTGRFASFNRSAFVNSVSGRLETQLKHGNVKLVEESLKYLKEQEEKRKVKKPLFSSRHGIFKKLEKAKAEKPMEKPTGIKKIQDYKGVSVVNNHDEDRIQLLFDEKPNEEIRTKLKRNGWHWSNKHGAWQRKATRNAITDSRILLGTHFEVD